jgi:uncharacterized protein YneF (UPF0154 family)
MKILLISVGFIAGLWIGWFLAINFTLSVIDRKQGD